MRENEHAPARTAAIEAAALATWPALETVADGRWVARFAGGYTKRANSILSLDPADDRDAPARLDRLAAFYRDKGLDPVFRITPLTGPQTLAALDATGWVEEDHSLVMTVPLEGSITGPDAAVFAPTDPVWLDMQARLNAIAPGPLAVFAEMMARLPASACGFAIYEDGAPLASALAAISGGIGVFSSVVVAPDRRGEGHGRAIMRAALAWAAAHGAVHAGVQVLAGNAPALSLYRALGFAERYSYCYRRGH